MSALSDTPISALRAHNRMLIAAETLPSRAASQEICGGHGEDQTCDCCGRPISRANVPYQIELEELNATLREANQHKDEVLAMLAHELRNPLASINNAVLLMSKPQLPNSQLGWVRDMITRQVGYLMRLIEDLLDVERITQGKINLTRESVPLSIVVSRALETVQPMLMRLGHELVLDVSAEPLYIDGDLTRLIQIVGNVLGNAVKYTRSGGRIELQAGDVGDRIEIRVRDNGIGIEPQLIPTVFNLFAQASHPERSREGGLGIGLALVKRLVELHGGEVEAHSEGLGKGSEFIMRFPRLHVVSSEALAREGRAPTASLTPASGPRRVLIADANRDTLESLTRLLQRAGHEVYQAADGLQALAAVSRLHPDVALIDIGMPGLDGYEVARRIRRVDSGGSTMIVALTALGQASDRGPSSDAGFDAHLAKPLDALKLSALLDSAPVRAAMPEPALFWSDGLKRASDRR